FGPGSSKHSLAERPCRFSPLQGSAIEKIHPPMRQMVAHVKAMVFSGKNQVLLFAHFPSQPHFTALDPEWTPFGTERFPKILGHSRSVRKKGNRSPLSKPARCKPALAFRLQKATGGPPLPGVQGTDASERASDDLMATGAR